MGKEGRRGRQQFGVRMQKQRAGKTSMQVEQGDQGAVSGEQEFLADGLVCRFIFYNCWLFSLLTFSF